MPTKTIDDTWGEIRRAMAELEARADESGPRVRARLEDRLDALRQEETAAWATFREKAEAVDEQFRQLEIDIAIAEHRLASEIAEDATAFAGAVEAELDDWDSTIERLQTRSAAKAGAAREQAEAEISALRRARNRVGVQLSELSTSPHTWQEQRSRVTEALEDLERKTREAGSRIQ